MSGGTVSQSLGGLSSPILATIGGKQYKFGLLTQKAKSALERIIQDRVRNELAVSKQDMSDEEYRLAYGAYMDRISSGAFAFGGVICRTFLTSSSGLEALLKVLAGIPAEEASSMLMQHADDVGHIIGQVFTESFPKARTRNTEPLSGEEASV
jgi:hypothetical protein